MKTTMIKRLAMLVAASTAIASAVAVQKMDLRLPDGSVFSVAADFDAMRRGEPDFLGEVRKAILVAQNEVISRSQAREALRGLDALEGHIKDFRNDCGFGPEDLHSLVLCVEAPIDYVDILSQLEAVMTSSPLDWGRIAAYCAAKGFSLDSNTWFGREVKVLCRESDDEYDVFNLEIVPDAPGVTYLNGSAIWEARHGKRVADSLPLRNGEFEQNEVVRIVFGDMKRLPNHHLVTGLRDELANPKEIRLSFYLSEGKLEIRAFLSFADEKSVKPAKTLLAGIIQEAVNEFGLGTRTKAVEAWLNGFSVTGEGCVVKIGSTPCPLSDILVWTSEPLASILGGLVPHSSDAMDPAKIKARKSLEFRLMPENEEKLLLDLPERAPKGYDMVNGDYRRRSDWKAEDDDGIAQFGAAVKNDEPVRLVFQADDKDKVLFHPRFVCEKVELTGESIESASAQRDGFLGSNAVAFKLDDAGRYAFRKLTSKNVGRQLAILYEGKLISSPVIRDTIAGGEGQITGNFTKEEAQRLAELLTKP